MVWLVSLQFVLIINSLNCFQPTGGAPSLVPALPQTPTQQTGDTIFTPAYDPSAAPSPYSAPPANMSMQHTAPTPPRGIQQL